MRRVRKGAPPALVTQVDEVLEQGLAQIDLDASRSRLRCAATHASRADRWDAHKPLMVALNAIDEAKQILDKGYEGGGQR